jgi:hypothetical protein
MADEQQPLPPQPAQQQPLPPQPAQQQPLPPQPAQQQPLPPQPAQQQPLPRLSQMRDNSVVGTGWKVKDQGKGDNNLQYGRKITETLPESD